MLRSPVWRGAFVSGWTKPAVVTAAVVAGAVLGVAAAAGPMYVSASANTELAVQAHSQCSWESAITVGDPLFTSAVAALPVGLQAANGDPGLRAPQPAQGLAVAQQRAGRLSRSVAGLDGAVFTLQTPSLQAGRTGDPPGLSGSATLLARTGALDHVQRLTPPGRQGVWISDLLASTSHIRPGDGLTVAFSGRRSHLPVAGIYRDLKAEPDVPSSWWCSLANEIYYQPPDFVPPPIVLADPATVIAVAERLRVPVIPAKAELAVTTLGSAQRTRSLLGQVQRAAPRLGLGAKPVQLGSGAGLRSDLPFEVPRAVALASSGSVTTTV